MSLVRVAAQILPEWANVREMRLRVSGALVAAGTNGNAPGTFFYTLASTNLALPLTNWTVPALVKGCPRL